MPLIDDIKTRLAPTLARRKIHKAILFGSLARKTGTRRSDIDLLIITDTDERFFDRYRHFDDIYRHFKGRDVDLLIYTPSELERIAHRPFVKRILTEGQVVYPNVAKAEDAPDRKD